MASLSLLGLLRGLPVTLGVRGVPPGRHKGARSGGPRVVVRGGRRSPGVPAPAGAGSYACGGYPPAERAADWAQARPWRRLRLRRALCLRSACSPSNRVTPSAQEVLDLGGERSAQGGFQPAASLASSPGVSWPILCSGFAGTDPWRLGDLICGGAGGRHYLAFLARFSVRSLFAYRELRRYARPVARDGTSYLRAVSGYAEVFGQFPQAWRVGRGLPQVGHDGYG